MDKELETFLRQYTPIAEETAIWEEGVILKPAERVYLETAQIIQKQL